MPTEDEIIAQAVERLKENDKDAARDLLQQALKINPKNEQARTLLTYTIDSSAEWPRVRKRSTKPVTPAVHVEGNDPAIQNQKPSFWSKTNRLRAAIIFLTFTLIPFVWDTFTDRIPTLRAVNRMTGEWNVAVAGFSSPDSDLRRTDIITIGSIFSNRFNQAMNLLSDDTNLVVQVWGPQDVDQTISGDSAEKRATNAEKIAEKINADMVIYGTIQQIEGGYLLQPEFYIRAENYYEADELIGQHRFGGAISILATRDTIPSQLPLNIELTRRSEIMAMVARGLSLYLVHSYDQALQLFTRANEDDLWQNPDGREAIYLFQGNAAIRLQQYGEAKHAYSQAVQIEPQYARGYIGLGNVSFLQSSEVAGQRAFAPNILDIEQAQKYYEQALQVDIQPASADIPSKAAFGLGQVYMVKWLLGEDSRDQAIEQFNKVLNHYAEGANRHLQELASESHARLGVIYRQDGQAEAALAEFQQALDLSTLPARRALYFASLSDLNMQQGDPEQAQNASRLSIEQYKLALVLPISDELTAFYWAKIGERYEYLQETAQAIDAYEHALNLLPMDSMDYHIYQERLKTLLH